MGVADQRGREELQDAAPYVALAQHRACQIRCAPRACRSCQTLPMQGSRDIFLSMAWDGCREAWKW